MLNPNAKPFHYQKMRQQIMSPAAYNYQKPYLPLPPPVQLFKTIYPNPSLPVAPQLCNPFCQKPSLYYSPPPPPPPHHHHQQPPLPVSAKTQKYYWLTQLRSNKKTTKTISNSVMMRIYPHLNKKHSREMLMEIVDEHCIEENKIVITMSNHDDHQDTILSEYDFLYLPIDFVRRAT